MSTARGPLEYPSSTPECPSSTHWGTAGAGASNIVFSNGLYDPWSSGGVLRNLSDTVRTKASVLQPCLQYCCDVAALQCCNGAMVQPYYNTVATPRVQWGNPTSPVRVLSSTVGVVVDVLEVARCHQHWVVASMWPLSSVHCCTPPVAWYMLLVYNVAYL